MAPYDDAAHGEVPSWALDSVDSEAWREIAQQLGSKDYAGDGYSMAHGPYFTDVARLQPPPGEHCQPKPVSDYVQRRLDAVKELYATADKVAHIPRLLDSQYQIYASRSQVYRDLKTLEAMGEITRRNKRKD